MLQKYFILYHDDCIDGFLAMYLMRKYLMKVDVETTCIPVRYHEEPPIDKIKSYLLPEQKAKVFIVDFCYTLEHLKLFEPIATMVNIFDHHESAAQIFGDYGVYDYKHNDTTIKALLDEHYSGAAIVHEYTRLEDPTLKYFTSRVEDHDLWIHQYDDTAAVQEVLVKLPRTFEAWDEFFNQPISLFKPLIDQAARAIQFRKELVDRIVEKATLVNFEGYEVPFVNCSHDHCSYVGQELYKNYPFAFMYEVVGNSNVRDSKLNCIRVSLRADKSKGFDLTIISKKYLGGGHKSAAGFYMDIYQFNEIIKTSKELKHD